ncbi:hypothetical protein [Rhodopseudomonas parapalustris]
MVETLALRKQLVTERSNDGPVRQRFRQLQWHLAFKPQFSEIELQVTGREHRAPKPFMARRARRYAAPGDGLRPA